MDIRIKTDRNPREMMRDAKKWMIGAALLIAATAFQQCAGPSEKSAEEAPKKNVQYVSGADEVTYRKLGKEIVDTIGSTLKKNLVSAMQDGGPVNAVKFCNAEALPLTALYNDKYNTEVRRVSDRNRNPKNVPDKTELAVIQDYRNTMEDGEKATPRVAIDAEGRKHFYAPIFTGGVCLTCHGNEKNMQPKIVQTIDSLYPNDNAKNFTVDELRGIWSVTFKNS